jgi:hypothetical protein
VALTSNGRRITAAVYNSTSDVRVVDRFAPAKP